MPRGPFQIGDFVGQRKNIAPLLRQQDGAMARGEPLGHSLLTGPSGTGKSLLARTLAKRGGTDLIKFVGDVSVAEVVGGLAELDPCDVAFFDEAHNLSDEVQELLFDVIDKAEVPAKHAQLLPGGKPKKLFKVAPATLVFATDRPGKLLNALHKRIVNRVHFDPYSLPEMKEIVELVASRPLPRAGAANRPEGDEDGQAGSLQRDGGVLLSPQAARRLAAVCNGLPRRAEHYVGQVRFHFPDAERRQLSVADVNTFLESWGIDEDGLGKQERRYVRFVSREGSASLETLASVLGCDTEYVKAQVEQPLRYRGLIRIKSSGRVLTKAGVALVERWRSAREARNQEG